jgi:hypothetical protein
MQQSPQSPQSQHRQQKQQYFDARSPTTFQEKRLQQAQPKHAVIKTADIISDFIKEYLEEYNPGQLSDTILPLSDETYKQRYERLKTMTQRLEPKPDSPEDMIKFHNAIRKFQKNERKKRSSYEQMDKVLDSSARITDHVLTKNNCFQLSDISDMSSLYQPPIFKIYSDINHFASQIANELFTLEEKLIHHRLANPGFLRTFRQHVLGHDKKVKEKKLQRAWDTAIISWKLQRYIAFELKLILQTYYNDEDNLQSRMTIGIYRAFRAWLEEYDLFHLDEMFVFSCSENYAIDEKKPIDSLYICSFICNFLLQNVEQIHALKTKYKAFSQEYKYMFENCKKIIKTLEPFLSEKTRQLLLKYKKIFPRLRPVLG